MSMYEVWCEEYPCAFKPKTSAAIPRILNETLFQPFPKMPRLNREIIITEKIDGTNAQAHIFEDGSVLAGSRTRYLTPENDNYGFAQWVKENETNLRTLGPGRHFGEWWGYGINRNYGQTERHFSLLNVSRWNREIFEDNANRKSPTPPPFVPPPACCGVVPLIYRGPFAQDRIEISLRWLRDNGSFAAPGFMNPEGIVVYHTAAGHCFKVTIKNDDLPKSL